MEVEEAKYKELEAKAAKAEELEGKIGDIDKFKAEAAETKAKLKEFQDKQAAAEDEKKRLTETELFEKKKYKDLAELKAKEAEELKKQIADQNNTIEESIKFSAIKQEAVKQGIREESISDLAIWKKVVQKGRHYEVAPLFDDKGFMTSTINVMLTTWLPVYRLKEIAINLGAKVCGRFEWLSPEDIDERMWEKQGSPSVLTGRKIW